MALRLLALLAVLPLLLPAASVEAQDPPIPAQTTDGWNSERALELAARARAARRELVRSGDLESYRALTEGHIYFFVDPEEGERSLIRVDQIAVDLFWEAPDHVRQRLVGERSETRLPVRDFAYYLDRLTLVQYGFGDEIQVGQGMDVAGVPHPFAPLPPGDSSESPYDFRLADSTTLHLPGEPEPLRIYELQVRPKDPSQPGILGSIHVDRSRADLVRMDFTFTPSSYVDDRTDRIAVELDYGLWEGQYWLPNVQRIEVRREIPEFDLGVGTVIRAVLRVGNYELNAPIPTEIRLAPRITTLSEEALADYSFRDGLFSGLERDGLADIATRADPRELRVEAARLLRNRPPTGLSPVRLHLPDASSLVSWDRARGLEIGGGLSIRPAGTTRVRLAGGWSFGPGHPRASLELDGLSRGDWVFRVSGALNGRGDLGIAPAVPSLPATLTALSLGEDYRDPYRSSGVTTHILRRMDRGSRLQIDLGIESHRSATLQRATAPWNSAREFRPVLPVEAGTFPLTRARWTEPIDRLPGDGRGEVTLEGTTLGGPSDLGARVEVSAEGRWRSASTDRDLTAKVTGGALLGTPRPQHHRLIGGRGTLPGHPFRSFAGRHLALGSLIGAADLGSPMIRIRGGVYGGWIDGRLPDAWRPDGADAASAALPHPAGTDGVAGGLSLGFGLLYDLVRVEGARGLGGRAGEWQLLISVDPRWWDFL